MKITPPKKLAMTCALILLANANNAVADLATDADAIFNWGEKTYPQLLTSPQNTQTLGPWFYRYYPQTAIYVGVNSQNNGVYVLYSQSSVTPVFVENVTDLIKQNNIIDVSSNPPATPVPTFVPTPEPQPVPVPVDQAQCDSSVAPAGINYVQDGNNLSITTGGQCIAFPTNDICLPQAPVAGGVSILKSLDVQSYQLNGINFVTPSMATLFEPQIKSYANIKTCVINGSQNFANLNLSLNGCFDVTAMVGNFPSITGLVTVAPPVTMQLQGNLNIVTVADCFGTDATMVTNAITHQIWDRKNGVFVLR